MLSGVRILTTTSKKPAIPLKYSDCGLFRGIFERAEIETKTTKTAKIRQQKTHFFHTGRKMRSRLYLCGFEGGWGEKFRLRERGVPAGAFAEFSATFQERIFSSTSKKSGNVLPQQAGSSISIHGEPSPRRSKVPSTPKLIATRWSR